MDVRVACLQGLSRLPKMGIFAGASPAGVNVSTTTIEEQSPRNTTAVPTQ
jgi:hypothetical protein